MSACECGGEGVASPELLMGSRITVKLTCPAASSFGSQHAAENQHTCFTASALAVAGFSPFVLSSSYARGYMMRRVMASASSSALRLSRGAWWVGVCVGVRAWGGTAGCR